MTHVCLWKNAWKFHLNRTRFNQMTAILKIRTLYSARGYSKTGRSIFFNCSRPGSRNDLKFFSLCPCLYWAPATKVSSRPDENFLSESLYNRKHGTKFYQLKAKMEANKFPSSHFSMEDKRVAVELWKAGVPLKNIREQLKMLERSLQHILAHAKSCGPSRLTTSTTSRPWWSPCQGGWRQSLKTVERPPSTSQES